VETSVDSENWEQVVQAAWRNLIAELDAAAAVLKPLEEQWRKRDGEAKALERRRHWYTSRGQESPISRDEINALEADARDMFSQLAPARDNRWAVERALNTVAELTQGHMRHVREVANDVPQRVEALTEPCGRGLRGEHVLNIGTATENGANHWSGVVVQCAYCRAGYTLSTEEAAIILLAKLVGDGTLPRMPQLVPTPALVTSQAEDAG